MSDKPPIIFPPSFVQAEDCGHTVLDPTWRGWGLKCAACGTHIPPPGLFEMWKDAVWEMNRAFEDRGAAERERDALRTQLAAEKAKSDRIFDVLIKKEGWLDALRTAGDALAEALSVMAKESAAGQHSGYAREVGREQLDAWEAAKKGAQ